MELPGLKDKVVLVTGAGRGIGKTIALSFAEQGSLVLVGDINLDEASDTAKIATDQYKVISQAYKLDVTNRPEVQRVVDAIFDEYHRIDILVNNAGVSTMARAVDITEEEWDFNMNVNAKGVFNVSQSVVKRMIEKSIKGKIINIASQAGRQGFPLFAHYCASKFAVIGFTQSLALEVGKYGVTVNAICPGFVKTSMQVREILWEAELRGISPEDVIKDYIDSIPLGRLQEPQDVANVTLFLGSSLADYITGASIEANGGSCMV